MKILAQQSQDSEYLLVETFNYYLFSCLCSNHVYCVYRVYRDCTPQAIRKEIVHKLGKTLVKSYHKSNRVNYYIAIIVITHL